MKWKEVLSFRLRMLRQNLKSPMMGVITARDDEVRVRSVIGWEYQFCFTEDFTVDHKCLNTGSVDTWFTSLTFPDGSRIELGEDMEGYWELRERLDSRKRKIECSRSHG